MLSVPDQNDERAHEDAERLLFAVQGIHHPQGGGQGYHRPFSGYGGAIRPYRERYRAGAPKTARW